jgi:hypothetical protein
MSFRRLLTHSCTIVRTGQVTGEDPYGNPIKGTVPERNIPCRGSDIERRVTSDAYGTETVVENVLFLLPNQGFEEDSVITDIVDSRGNVVFEGTYKIASTKKLYRRSVLHHYELVLKGVDAK